jgi:hypothetical protein
MVLWLSAFWALDIAGVDADKTQKQRADKKE